ncbi:hypothetical protein PF005_g3231 [Phytophthora fragariae]|uniref:protein-serine/threonine phosphatase n=1 Tax=Phytophthora fragariae TaxID=53985 RepID=A0A6A4AC77_9STRA|nr:hypothetical protein PF009_g3450 [Phytophthora fragariae]KAE9026357.1 hypothetical protein PF011_g2580 [Phytophthora fragariae]KAE9133504.1 hypothetical protein PF010_g2776 [Phytophthora fragariae]KAE9133740.1 hypothetical protein PF007_g3203 [Phytophthora fragariae]KAE9153219.1 hypothetical protein PF006_g2615 [Phytophthora fragariae]
MMPITRSKTQTNLYAGPKPEGAQPGSGVSQNAMFSRRSVSISVLNKGSAAAPPTKQLANLNLGNPLASIVHRADKNGKQQSILASGRTATRQGSKVQPRGSFRDLFVNIWSAFGSNEQQQATLNKSNQDRSSQLKPTKAAAAGTNVVELRRSILPPRSVDDSDKMCLVLDLDETLVHSSFRPTTNPDFIIPVEIDGTIHHVFVAKRPGAEEFLVEMAKYYEIVVYTASLSKYADPLLDQLDPEVVIKYRLYREHCVQYEGNYVKDLSLLARELSQTIIIDNSPMSYIFHPRNAIGCSSFIDDPNDRELESISRFLVKHHDVQDVCDHLHIWDANY